MVTFRYSLPLLFSHVESFIEKVELLACSGVSWVCLSLCVAVSLLADRMSGPYEEGGGKPVILTYLLWFQSPHIPTYTLTHSAAAAAAAALGMGVFHSKTPVVTFSSISHSFHLKVRTSRKGGFASYLMDCCCLTVKMNHVSFFLF